MQTRGFQRMRSYIRQRFKGMRSYTRQRFKGRRFQRMRSYTTQRFKRRRLHPYNTRLGNRHWNETKESKHAEREEVVTSCLAPRIEPPINPIEVQGCLSGRIAEDENLMKVLEMCQDNGKFEEHDRLVTKKIRYYEEEKKNRTMVWALKIEKSATDSYQNKWKQARKQLVSVTLSDLIVEYSDVLKARASYLLVAHMRRKKIYRKSKAGLLCLLNRLEDSKRLLHGYNSPEDWAELYQTYGCVRMDYMSQVPLDKRNVEQEKAMDCFRRAIYFSNQDHRERVQMKRQSYVHLKLAMIHLGCPLAPENHLPLNDIKEAKKHVDIVQSRFRDTLPTATKMLLWKTQSYLFYHQGKYKQAKHKAVDAHKCALRHGFNTEVDILKERIDFCQKKLETHDQILSASEKPVRHEAYSTSQSTASAESAARQITSESPLPPDLHGQMFMNLQQMQRNVGNSNTDPLADLEKIASDKGFVISDNEGSGNCMFHALSEQLTLLKRIKISHGELRQSMVQYLRKNPKLPDGTDLFNFTNGYRSWADYLTDMEQDGTWGDHVILYVTANRYKTSIHVISGQSNHCDLIIEPDGDVISTNPLVLGHVHEVHYVSLQPKQEKQSNRRTAHKGYRLQQKVTEHPQKQRKEAKLNGKSKKKHSKWMTADKGYKIQQKVMEHRRKQRKEAKLNGKSKITFKEGQLSDRELDELAGKIAAKWEPLGIHLGISQNALDVIAVNKSDKPKAMLLHWRNTSTCTSCKVLYQALCHERVGLNNVAKEFCLQSESR